MGATWLMTMTHAKKKSSYHLRTQIFTRHNCSASVACLHSWAARYSWPHCGGWPRSVGKRSSGGSQPELASLRQLRRVRSLGSLSRASSAADASVATAHARRRSGQCQPLATTPLRCHCDGSRDDGAGRAVLIKELGACNKSFGQKEVERREFVCFRWEAAGAAESD